MSRVLDPVPLLLGGLAGAVAGAIASYAIDGRVDWPLVVAILVATLVTSLAILVGAGPTRGIETAVRTYGVPPRGGGRWQFRGMPPSPVGPPPVVGTGQGQPRLFDRFDPTAKRVLALAQEEAIRFKHNYIGTEHLLLGLVRETDSVSGRALAELGVDIDKVRTAVEFIIGRGEAPVEGGDITLSPRSKKVIDLGIDEAMKLGHAQAGSGHLLLGLVREGEGIGSGVLESLGVGLAQTRQKVIELIAREGPPPASPPPAT